MQKLFQSFLQDANVVLIFSTGVQNFNQFFTRCKNCFDFLTSVHKLSENFAPNFFFIMHMQKLQNFVVEKLVNLMLNFFHN